MSVLRKIFGTGDQRGGNDASLLARIADRDRERALEEIMKRYGEMVYFAAFRIANDKGLAEECAQDAFLLLLKKAGEIESVVNLGGWLHRVTVNIAKTKVRSSKRRLDYERRAAEFIQIEGEEKLLFPSEMVPLLDGVIDSLGESLRRPIVLCYLEGIPQKEASALIGCSESTLSRRLQKALEVLRKRFQAKGMGLTTACIGFALTEGSRAEASGYSLSRLAEGTLSRMAQEGGIVGGGTVSGLLTIMSMKKNVALIAGVLGMLALLSSVGGLFVERDPEEANEALVLEETETREKVVDHSGIVEPELVVEQVEDVEEVSVLSDAERKRMIVSVAYLKTPYERWQLLKQVGFDLSLEEVEALPGGVSANKLREALFDTWLRKDAKAAIAWFQELGVLNSKLFYQWAQFDASAALAFAERELPESTRWRESLLRGLDMIDNPLGWVERLSKTEGAEERGEIVGELGYRWLESDPERAMEWFEADQSLSEAERAKFLGAGLHEVARVDPVSALELLPTLASDFDSGMYEFHVRQVMRYLALQDPSGAKEVLDTFAGSERMSALEGYAAGYARSDIAGAMDWALDLDLEELPKALQGIVPEADGEDFDLLMEEMLERPASQEIDAALLSWIGLEPDYLESDREMFQRFLDTRMEQQGASYVGIGSDTQSPLGKSLLKGANLLSSGIAQSEGPEAAIEWLATLPMEEGKELERLLPNVLSIWKFLDGDAAQEWVDSSAYSEEQKAKLRRVR